MSVQVLQGDCIQVMKALKDNSVDSVCCDPPYGLEFMNREWDGADGFRRSLNEADAGRDNVFGRTSKTGPEYKTGKSRIRKQSEHDRTTRDNTHNSTTSLVARNAPEAYVAGPLFQRWCETWAAECLRVLKPGGHLLAFGGTRTYHRMACAIEDAGFEIRDSLHWVYGSGFPKSMDVSKAIDKAAGVEREIIGPSARHGGGTNAVYAQDAWTQANQATMGAITVPATDDAAAWAGWGTAVKPSHEPIVVARKPLIGTVASNVLKYGTGALNIDGCRVAHVSEADRVESENKNRHADFGSGARDNHIFGDMSQHARAEDGNYDGTAGRWPPNILLTHSADCIPVGVKTVRGDNRKGGTGRRPGGFANTGADSGDPEPNGPLYGSTQAEAWDCAEDCPVAEMDSQSGVLHSQDPRTRRSGKVTGGQIFDLPGMGACYDDKGGASRFFPCFRYQAKAAKKERPSVEGVQGHPTVKPIELMRWLVRLVTPPGGICLDPFAGSGTTGEACLEEGFNCILIEREPDYIKLINARLDRREPTLWD